MQASRRDLENFLKWIQEAETTLNVLADASQRENALQDGVLARELKQQMQVNVWKPHQGFCLCPAFWIHLHADLLLLKGEVATLFSYEIHVPL